MASAAGFGQLLKQVAGPSLTSGALAGGLSLLTGANPLQALLSGAADAGASAASLGALRKLQPKAYGTQRLKDVETGEIKTVQKTSPLEIPVNIAASLGTSYATAPLIYGGQQEQIAQQLGQRSVVNHLPLEQELANLSPGTMSQVPGAQFQQLLNRASQNSYTQYLSPQEQELLASGLNPRMM